jgi:hypothetical protein
MYYIAFQFIAVFIGNHRRRKAKETWRNIVNQVMIDVYFLVVCLDQKLHLYKYKNIDWLSPRMVDRASLF